ncbi:hypothetical protein QOZ80_9AG0684340 [Eleusine coracana subsp. coracana]|nr:hypothetical protein QOZ80_9AG0684340 [Eleusine coracana subsp. coracana]
MGGVIEKKVVFAEQTVVEEKLTVVRERLAAIEEGMEEEEGVEKERAEEGKIGSKKRHGHMELQWCTSSSFLEKGMIKEPQLWTKIVTEKGATSTTKGEKGDMETLKEVPTQEITLTSSDGKQFKMPQAAARLSSILADMIDDKGFTNDKIPLPHISSHSLFTVIKYCDKHAAAAATKPDANHNAINKNTMGNTVTSEETLEEWDRNLIDILNTDALFDLINAANFLNIKDLYEITCQKVADMIKGKTPNQMREMFHVTEDFTKEEKEQMLKDNFWAFPSNN